MSEIKKKYNHIAIESEFSKKRYFQKLFITKKTTTKWENIIISDPIIISKEMDLNAISDLIKKDIVAKYQIMKWIKTTIIPIIDTENKNIKTEYIKNILTKAGIFFDITEENIIYSEKNTNFVRNIFAKLAKEGNIYEDYSINYRSIQEQKTLSTNEIVHKKMQVKQYNLRYFVDTKNVSLIVPTLYPETIFADVALAVHPDDKRYKKLTKSKVIIPIINKPIPIITDESVDPTKGTGIIRITPAHDKKSLIIAQKHGLEINKFAITKNGCFSESAGEFWGKSAHEFTKNIIKNLDDIHNLESTKFIEAEIVLHYKTGEKARPLLCNQLFIKTDTQRQVQWAIQDKQITVFPEEYEKNMEDIIENITYWPVTKEDTKGYFLPFWKSNSEKNYFISDTDFFNLPAKKTKNKYTILSLIIFNLIVDHRLKVHFTIEECIDVVMSKSNTWEKNTLETYIDMYSETLPRWYSKEINELKKIITYTEKEKWINNFEKFSISLTDILEKSIAIINKKKWLYFFSVDTLVHHDEWLIQQQEKIEENLGHTCVMIKALAENTQNKQKPIKIYCSKTNKLFEFLKIIMIGYDIEHTALFDKCYLQEESTSKKNKTFFKDTITDFWTDCTRLYANNNTKNITEYQQFLNKLRNASRFIYQHIYNKKWARKISDFKQLTSYLEKRKNNINDIELRSIYKIIELQKEYEENMAKYTPYKIQEKIISIITEDFCDKYLEIQKYQNSEYGDKVTLRCLGTLLKLLHPFTPYITQQIRENIGFDWPILTQSLDEHFTNISKNYKIQLFMDIIEKFWEMKENYSYAKHEEIDICFLAPLEFLQYLRQQENIIYKLINTSSIEYLENEKDIDTYHIENIINITIGIKKQEKKVTTKETKEYIQEILHNKEQELQSIRTMISGISANDTDQDLIKTKKKEMSKLKKEIEQIHYEIQKHKMNK